MTAFQPPLILASGSPQRRRLLQEAGYAFQVIAPQVEEPNPALFSDAAAYAAYTAWLKARWVQASVPQGTVLAADTVVACGGAILGKPDDKNDARRILTLLSGSDHQVLTGVCLWPKPGSDWVGSVDCTELHMRSIPAAELEAYLETNRWVEKAGAYAIQDPDPYVTVVQGSYTNVVGLPMELLKRLLGEFPVP